MRKNLKFENAKRSIKWLTDRRILTHAFFLVGFPTETEEEIQATIEFSKEITAHTASFFIVNPFKGTELADIVEKRGGKATQDYRVSGYFDPEAANLGISEVAPDKLREPRWLLRMLTPGSVYFFRELTGLFMNERSNYLNLSDGGHVENLALYELLRRRCKFIIAIETGESGVPESRTSGKIPPPPMSSSVLPMKPPGR